MTKGTVAFGLKASDNSFLGRPIKGETITRVNGDISINCSKRLQIE
jgi:hypothetical protein